MDKEIIINACENWVNNHKDENLLLTYSSIIELLDVLKEQKEVTVISIHRNGFGSRIGACPNCQSVLHYEYNQSFCGKCGLVVKWE